MLLICRRVHEVFSLCCTRWVCWNLCRTSGASSMRLWIGSHVCSLRPFHLTRHLSACCLRIFSIPNSSCLLTIIGSSLVGPSSQMCLVCGAQDRWLGEFSCWWVSWVYTWDRWLYVWCGMGLEQVERSLVSQVPYNNHSHALSDGCMLGLQRWGGCVFSHKRLPFVL